MTAVAPTLLLDGEEEVLQEVLLPSPWSLDTERGMLTVDDILDLDPEDWLKWANELDDAQTEALLSVVTDPTIEQYARFRTYRDNPIGFIRDVLREYAWSIQREIAESVRDNRKTSVPSCHGAGKSFIAACIIAWWIACHAPGDAFVVTTAPTGAQVRAILWRYLNRMHAGSELPGRTNMAQWYIGNELVAIGRKPADTNPAAFQGLHARFLLVIVDEADGVHADIFGALQTLVTTEFCRILAIGNPDTNAGRFYDANMPGSDWNVIRISAFDTPNFNGHPLRSVPDEVGVPAAVRENLVDQAFVDDIANDNHYGEDSAYYRSKVLAIAPEDAPSAVMPLSRLRECMPHRDPADRLVRWNPDTLELTLGQDLGPVEIGLDVGGGGDLTVARERRGPVLGRVLRIKDSDPMRQVRQIVQFFRLCGADVAKVDVIGVGWALAGRLAELKTEGAHSTRIAKVNVGRAGRKSTGRRPGFPKLRDQIWWEVGRANTLDKAWDLSVLYDEEWVLPELYQPTYTELLGGQTKIESKDEMKKRLKHSPDDADAILLAYAKVAVPGSASAEQLLGARLG